MYHCTINNYVYDFYVYDTVNPTVTCDAISGSGNPTTLRVSLAFTRYIYTVVARIYSAVTDSVDLYDMGRVNLNLFLACIRRLCTACG